MTPASAILRSAQSFCSIDRVSPTTKSLPNAPVSAKLNALRIRRRFRPNEIAERPGPVAT